MMGEAKVLSLLGIARKAGKVILGTDMTVESIRSGKKNSVILMLMASDASKNAIKRIENTSAYYKIPLIRLEADKSELARLTGGKAELSVVGITDNGFANAMLSAMQNENNKGNG